MEYGLRMDDHNFVPKILTKQPDYVHNLISIIFAKCPLRNDMPREYNLELQYIQIYS